MIRLLIGMALLAGLILLAQPAAATADVSAECWRHLSVVDTARTPAADRRFHLERGEFSPCTEHDANDGLLPKASSDGGKDKDKDRDKKSRHCRKHWYC
ncbi:site-specific recombination directionality factor RDF [Mycobacterium phage Miramae]|uniref:RDF protein n=1 Tax=Mycobacterium phage Miramae TaxID=2517961 RepID=A0A482JGZ4_9CAUD|nr:site-specific recombination directionality factor RDF [Mycobacterium phage Miramae]QBP31459.1 hypothetical protein SEA_MIRAMAE_74 [Mycobacterium phage Miramae]